jgi:DNA-binding NtrC family response regulator
VESASGGTLFLDEVGDIPPGMQVKLLRLLESGTYRRVGSTELRRSDVRVVSATHRDLPTMVADGRFREDLYYRLATFPIRLPPLRERAEDIPLLAAALLARLAPERRLRLAPAALRRLGEHRFPGNVRELRNVLERAALLCDGPVIEVVHVDRALEVAATGLRAAAVPPSTTHAHTAVTAAGGPGPATAAERSLREIEAEVLQSRLAAHRGSRAELARALGISERTLYRRLRAMPPLPTAAA